MSVAALVPLPGINHRAPAVAHVDPDELRDKLGASAWHVWSILCSWRNLRGECWPSVRGISRAKGWVRTHPRVVKAALKKLRAAGLVENVGWEMRETPRGERRVFVRRVFGAITLKKRRIKTWSEAMRGPEDVAIIPSTTTEWLSNASAWGGRRANAGRRSNASNASGSTPAKSSVSRLLSFYECEQGEQIEASEIKCVPGRKNQVCPRIVKQTDHEQDGPSLLRREGAAAPRPVELVEGVIIGDPSRRVAPALSLDEMRQLPGVPPYPDFRVVPPAVVPPAPVLDLQSGDTACAEYLARCYAHALRKRLGLSSRVARDVRRSKHFKVLVAASAALAEHEIAPAIWALWSCDVWSHYRDGKRGRPTMPWVFGVKRINERRGWFRRESSGYGAGRAIMSQHHRELLRRYELVRRALRVMPPDEAMRTHFPSGLFDGLVAAAREDTQNMRRHFEARLARGDFLWG